MFLRFAWNPKVKKKSIRDTFRVHDNFSWNSCLVQTL